MSQVAKGTTRLASKFTCFLFLQTKKSEENGGTPSQEKIFEVASSRVRHDCLFCVKPVLWSYFFAYMERVSQDKFKLYVGYLQYLQQLNDRLNIFLNYTLLENCKLHNLKMMLL